MITYEDPMGAFSRGYNTAQGVNSRILNDWRDWYRQDINFEQQRALNEDRITSSGIDLGQKQVGNEAFMADVNATKYMSTVPQHKASALQAGMSIPDYWRNQQASITASDFYKNADQFTRASIDKKMYDMALLDAQKLAKTDPQAANSLLKTFGQPDVANTADAALLSNDLKTLGFNPADGTIDYFGTRLPLTSVVQTGGGLAGLGKALLLGQQQTQANQAAQSQQAQTMAIMSALYGNNGGQTPPPVASKLPASATALADLAGSLPVPQQTNTQQAARGSISPELAALQMANLASAPVIANDALTIQSVRDYLARLNMPTQQAVVQPFVIQQGQSSPTQLSPQTLQWLGGMGIGR